MKQPHTEQAIKHTEDDQNTGNHKKPGTPGAEGADRFGGTRTGADNVEPAQNGKERDAVDETWLLNLLHLIVL